MTNIGWIDKQFLQDRVDKKLISGGDVEIGLRHASEYELWYNPTCKLRHIIPARRTSPKYLKNINYNLGCSKLLGDSMLWDRSYGSWLWVSEVQGMQDSVDILIKVLKVVIKRKPIIEVELNWSFTRGWWAGIWQLLCMNPKKRREFLGCAKHNHSSKSFKKTVGIGG